MSAKEAHTLCGWRGGGAFGGVDLQVSGFVSAHQTATDTLIPSHPFSTSRSLQVKGLHLPGPQHRETDSRPVPNQSQRIVFHDLRDVIRKTRTF